MTDKQPYALALADHLEQFRSFPNDLAAAAELRRLHAELVESDALREKMSDVLRRTATALKGEPDELTLHSWHDLPEVAMTLRYEMGAIAASKEERDALVPVGPTTAMKCRAVEAWEGPAAYKSIFARGLADLKDRAAECWDAMLAAARKGE